MIVPLPITLKFVDVEQFHGANEAASVHVPDPISKTRRRVPVLTTPEFEIVEESVRLYPLAENVPEVSVNRLLELELQVNASCKVTDPPGELKVKPCVNVFPALVIV